ncbi:30S ribosomal protein S17 [bacterium]|nr:30S ribosomal protein S17 [Verrucomicrobiota bacterium]NDH85776.1 30S ribosomal protein S17 [bacterium]
MTTTAEHVSVLKELTGEVISAKMEKTIVVQVERRMPHPKYKKIIRLRKKFYAHDEEKKAKEGDMVRIVACRPLSRLKRWNLVEVVKQAESKAEVLA